MTRNGHHVAVRKLRAFRHVRCCRCRSGVETVGWVRDHAGLYGRIAEPNKKDRVQDAALGDGAKKQTEFGLGEGGEWSIY